jgi:hypothetical protein
VIAAVPPPTARISEQMAAAARAELALLGCIILRPEYLHRTGGIGPGDFGDPRCREVFATVLDMRRAGVEIDPVHLEYELERTGRLKPIGGLAFLSEAMAASLDSDLVELYANDVRGYATARALHLAFSDLAGSGLVGSALVSAAQDKLDLAKARGGGAGERIPWLSTDDIFGELAPTPWLVRELLICPGRPALIAGYGYAGKTIATQALMLSVAVGCEVWGHFATGQPQRGRHLDFEQGQHATRKRYQRLLAGMDLHVEQLGGRLELTVFPDAYLNDAAALDLYSRLSDGCGIVFVDSLRAATPGDDENDSAIAARLQLLARVSEKTGACFVVIHHAGKPKEGHRDGRTLARGSSAIFDAAGAVFTLSGERGGPTLVQQVKAPPEAEGSAVDDFHLVIEDMQVGDNPRGGVRVRRRADDVKPKAAKPKSARYDAIKADVLTAIKAEDLDSANAIYARVDGNKGAVLQAIRELVKAEVIREVGGVYRVIG